MTRLILFLVRLKLGVKKFEKFKFSNQKDPTSHYYFDSYRIHKVTDRDDYIRIKDSRVSLNWLLNPECKIVLVEK